MAINFPGPGELRIFYTTNEPTIIAEHVFRHSFEFAVDPPTVGLTFSAYSANQAVSGTTDLETWTDDLVDLLAQNFHTTTDFTHAELWYYDAGTFDAVFVSVYPLGVSGAHTNATVIASQSIITMRTDAGGIFKVDLRGTVYAPAASSSFPTGNGDINALAAFLIAPSTVARGRDGGAPFSSVKFLPGQNERAWKQVNR